ncbi:MAG TPA: PPC domain-containing protein, partial [Wenzhouxiangella sp.]|nr:PPC domain-containing protein [Wenzhouxiangella sp.]
EINECTDEDDRRLDNDCKRSELSGSSPASAVWLYADVPSGQTRLEFRISGGTGDVDVYYKADSWPSESDFDQSSTNTGNDEYIQVNNPGEGWHYLLLVPKTDFFEDVEVSAHWQ